MRAELQGLPICEPHGHHWFWHGESVLALLDQHKPVTCVELGTSKGCSAIAVARLVRKWGGTVTCIDFWEPFGPVTMADCRANLDAAGVGDVVTLIRSRTDEAARAWSGWAYGAIDYLYIDADHSYASCTQDLELWWPHVRVGGLVAGDDYGDKRTGVTEAWDDFERTHDQSFVRTPATESYRRYHYPDGTSLIWGIKR